MYNSPLDWITQVVSAAKDSDPNAQRQAAADKARGVHKVKAGVVQIWDHSGGVAGKRQLPPDLDIRGVMGTVADLIEAGKDDEAAALISSATIAAYGGDYVGVGFDPEDGLAAILEVTEWVDGFDLR
jgi:hypothetical protein